MGDTARLEYHLGYGYVKDVYVAHFRYVLKIVEDLGSFVVRPTGDDRIRRVSFWMSDDDFGGFAATLQPAFPLVLLSSAVSTSDTRRLEAHRSITWPSRARRVNALVSVVSVTAMYRTESLCSYSM